LRAKSIFAVLVWLTATILIAPRVDTYNQIYATSVSAYDTPVFLRLLGEGRSILSNLSLLQADLYYHRGIGHFHDEHEGALGIIDERKGEYAHEEYSHEEKTKKISPFNILFRISEQTRVTEHVHLEGDQMKEIVPWLYYSAEVDPHNTLAYTLTGFYLADRLGKADEGIAFLREGLMNNPDSWQINAELGRIYYVHYKNYEAAIRFLSRAQTLLDEAPHDKFQERYVLSFLALSYEALGQRDNALPLYRRLHELFPDEEVFKKRLRGESY
jgi:tetratricopeptide (TPR) repeat protein